MFTFCWRVLHGSIDQPGTVAVAWAEDLGQLLPLEDCGSHQYVHHFLVRSDGMTAS